MNETLLTQLGIIAVMTGTPGPNNLLLMATGVHFGVRQSLPLVTGIVLGCSSMLLATSAGLTHLFEAFPLSKTLLNLFCAGFLGYMILGLLRANGSNSPEQKKPGALPHPWTICQGAAFQWMNPKAWLMCMTLASTVNAEASTLAAATVLAGYFCVGATPFLIAWSAGGYYLSHWLNLPGRLCWFNRIMALCLFACALGLLGS